MMSMTIVAKATPTSPTTVTQQQSSVGIQSSGSVKEIVGNYDMLFYVSDVKISNSTNSTTIEVLGIIKNLDLEPEAYTYSYGRLIDSQGRQYAVSYVTETANLAFPIPTNDTALVSIKFTIPPDAVSIANILSYQGLEVDISKTKSPPDPPPVSDWVASPNKGFRGLIPPDRSLELTISDERFQNAFYILNITVKNTKQSMVEFSSDNFYVKDKQGNVYQAETIGSTDQFRFDDLNPGGQKRGELAFQVGFSREPLILIYYDGKNYLYTGCHCHRQWYGCHYQ